MLTVFWALIATSVLCIIAFLILIDENSRKIIKFCLLGSAIITGIIAGVLAETAGYLSY